METTKIYSIYLYNNEDGSEIETKSKYDNLEEAQKVVNNANQMILQACSQLNQLMNKWYIVK